MTPKRILPLFAGLALVGSACSSDGIVTTAAVDETVTSSTTAPPVDSEPGAPEDGEEVDQVDGTYDPAILEAARSEFAEAQASWQSAGIDDYEIVVSLQGLIEQRTIVSGGVVTSVERLDDNTFEAELPQTVDEVFEDVDALIRAAEDDPVVDFNQCTGHFFNVRYDAELGYPEGWDSFSPCEDGVPFMALVTVG